MEMQSSTASVMTQHTDSQSLLIDLGGTHLRFAQVKDRELVHLEKLVCADFDSLASAISHYLNLYPTDSPLNACLAVASPLEGDKVQMTNSQWCFSLSELQKQLGFQQLHALNDFEAIAFGVPHLKREQLRQIGGDQREADGNMAVLGPGTGLGVKHLTHTTDGWKVLLGEGGHVDFAPVDDGDLQVWQYLKQSHSHVAAEEVLSGRGLVQIYRANCQAHQREAEFEDAAAIIEAGKSGRCPVCKTSLEQFLRILGSFAGNLALNLRTTGGVYLCGGVATALADLIDGSGFRARFEAKGRFESYVAGIPVYLITEPEPGLLGAFRYLQTMQG